MSLVEFVVSDIIPYYDTNTYVVTPDNVESFLDNPVLEGWNRLVVTGFNREPYWYVKIYNIFRRYRRRYVIVNPVYIPLDLLGDNYDVTISIYGYYRVLVVYDPDRIDRIIDRYSGGGDGYRLAVISDILPESDIVVHPINQQRRCYHNVDVIIDNTRDPKSVMEERIYLFEPSFDKTYVIVRNMSEKDYQQLPMYPELDIVQSHTTWFDILLNPSPYLEPSMVHTVGGGYERYYVQLEHYNTFHRRFTGKDDVDTLVNIWNTMVDEVGDVYNIQLVTQWARSNYIDPSWMLQLVTVSDAPNTKVKYDDIVSNIDDQPTYHRVSVGIYRSQGNWYYRSNLIPFSDIDTKPIPIIKRITPRLAIIV